MTLVIDASVAVKWVVLEAGSEIAAARCRDQPLAAPDFWLLECANVLWAKACRKLLTRSEAEQALRLVTNAGVRLHGTGELVDAAHALAHDLDVPVYDAVYVALAIREDARLLTADNQLADGVRRHPVHAARVVRLTDG